MRILYEGAKNETTFPHYLAVAVIVKNEGPYMYEWLEYHRMLGVTKFYVYDNESSDNLKVLLRPYINEGIVEYKYFSGKERQLAAYNNVLVRARQEVRWLAFIDVDEFIVLNSEGTINEFLRDFEEFPGIEINWVVYGSGGKESKEEGLVIERFKDHAEKNSPLNRHVKSIVNPRMVRCSYIHISKYLSNHKSVNEHKQKNVINFLQRNPSLDKIRINHYFTKSHREFIEKKNRGRADSSELLAEEHFRLHDRNEIKNDLTMDRFVSGVKERIRKVQGGQKNN